MNDTELISRARDAFGGIGMTTPLAEVEHRGRARRRRRRGLTGAAALTGALAIAAAAVLPGVLGGAARPAPPAAAQLTAWTVRHDPDGGITVTIRQLRDPAGLQATLRADGVPARVTFDPAHEMNQPLPAGCTAPAMSDAANAQLQNKILTPPAILAYEKTVPASPGRISGKGRGPGAKRGRIQILAWPASLRKQVEEFEGDPATGVAFYLNPAVIPHGIGVSLGVDAQSATTYGWGLDLVATSPSCTGAGSS